MIYYKYYFFLNKHKKIFEWQSLKRLSTELPHQLVVCALICFKHRTDLTRLRITDHFSIRDCNFQEEIRSDGLTRGDRNWKNYFFTNTDVWSKSFRTRTFHQPYE